MMIVITLNNCPPKVRGDLTKWLIEINTGVFVGNVNSKVRDAIWDRICDNIKDGRVSMAYHTNGEQKLDFRIHNSDWEPVDYDGIKLVRHNFSYMESDTTYIEKSKANIRHIKRLMEMNKVSINNSNQYVVIDVETTGLNNDDEIIELGAILIENKNIINSYSSLIKCDKKIPSEIVNLTGITQNDLLNYGISLKDALEKFSEFCGNNLLVGYNINFDINFLQKSCKSVGLPFIKNKTMDVMKLAKKKIFSNCGYSLSAIAKQLDIQQDKIHRVNDDCLLTYKIFEKLKED